MRSIAGGVFSTPAIHHAHTVSFRLFTDEYALTLVGIDIGDEGLLRLEIIADAVRLVLVVALTENRFTHNLTLGVGRIQTACGMHDAAVERHADVVGLQLEVLVVDLALAVEHGMVSGVVEGDGVACREIHGSIERTLAATHGIGLHGITAHGIGQHLNDLTAGQEREDTVLRHGAEHTIYRKLLHQTTAEGRI